MTGQSQTTTSSSTSKKVDISNLATWSVSTERVGSGVDKLRDGNPNTLWQSDGLQPHFILINFQHRVHVSSVSLLLNHALDDSYTPSLISVRAGTTPEDVQEVCVLELDRPQGWVHANFIEGDDEEGHEGDVESQGLGCHVVQIGILANHLNGKDTHIRGVQVFSKSWGDCALGEKDVWPERELQQYIHLR